MKKITRTILTREVNLIYRKKQVGEYAITKVQHRTSEMNNKKLIKSFSPENRPIDIEEISRYNVTYEMGIDDFIKNAEIKNLEEIK